MAILLGLMLMLPLAGAPAAAAKTGGKKLGPVTSSSAGAVAQSGGVASATAKCPGKTRAVGGGFSQTQANSSGAGLVFESQKVGQKQWRASSQLFSGTGQSLALTAYVYCRRRAPRTSTVTGSAGVSTDSGGTAQAGCSGKRRAVGGGFVMPLPAGPGFMGASSIADSLRADRLSWKARAVTGVAGGTTLTSLTYCANQKKVAKTASAASPPNTEFSVSTATATCPKKLKPLYGGFSTPGSVGALPNSFTYFVHESLASGNGWRSSGTYSSIGSAPAGVLNSFAYCG